MKKVSIFPNDLNDKKYSVKQALLIAKELLSLAAIETPILDARVLLGFVLGRPEERFYGLEDKLLGETELNSYEKIIRRRCKREPVSRILGQRDFWDLTLKLNPSSLDPRPDSETLIEAITKHVPNKNSRLNIIDLGTGTGCLLLAALKELPNSFGVGVDISDNCIKIAKENAHYNSLSNRTTFLANDWTQNITEKFDIILCNPPYIKETEIKDLEPEVKSFDPYIALNGGPDGLSCYKAIAHQFVKILANKGLIFLELGHKQKLSVIKIMKTEGLQTLHIEKDLGDKERCLVLSHNHYLTKVQFPLGLGEKPY
jgi:release factor glutamine methyltransferase